MQSSSSVEASMWTMAEAELSFLSRCFAPSHRPGGPAWPLLGLGTGSQTHAANGLLEWNPCWTFFLSVLDCEKKLCSSHIWCPGPRFGTLGWKWVMNSLHHCLAVLPDPLALDIVAKGRCLTTRVGTELRTAKAEFETYVFNSLLWKISRQILFATL